MAIKEIVPFSFNEIYSSVAKKFTDKGYDVQEGSNVMQLVTAMSYLTSMLNVNTAVNINETILSQSRKREMVLRNARALGYEVQQRQSYTYKLILNFTEIGEYTISQNEEFSAGDKKYYYRGEQINFEVTQITTRYYSVDIPKNIALAYNGIWQEDISGAIFDTIPNIEGYTFNEFSGVLKGVYVVEGILYAYTDHADLRKVVSANDDYYFDIPFTNIEENGLDVIITYIDSFGEPKRELWSKSTTFLLDSDTALNKQYVRLENIDTGTPRIYFKLGNSGNNLSIGTIIEINAIESNGVNGEMVSMPTTTLNCEILSYTLIITGAEQETNESIKTNAPLFNNTANRIVTKNDYKAFCNRQAAVRDSAIWDGNDGFPKRPGHVWFSFRPTSVNREITTLDDKKWELVNPIDKNNWYLEDTEIDNTFISLESVKIPTLRLHHRHPFYLDFDYSIELIKYSASLTKSEQHKRIFDVINNYFLLSEEYDFEYLNSNLIRRIDSAITDSAGISIHFETSIKLLDIHAISEEFDVCSGLRYIPDELFYDEIRFSNIGYSASISGDRIAVGNIEGCELDGSGTETGNVKIYDTFLNKLIDVEQTGLLPNDFYGRSVALSENRLIVGSPLSDPENRGKVYVYDFNGEFYQHSQTIISISSQSNAWFGGSVSLHNTTLVIGSVFDSLNVSSFAIGEVFEIGDVVGKVYIYEYVNGLYTRVGEIAPPEDIKRFGFGVAIDSNRIYVSSIGDQNNVGKVYVYRKVLNEYQLETILEPKEKLSGLYYGISIASDGEHLAIGAIGNETTVGRVYLYKLINNDFIEIDEITPSNSHINDGFGTSVSFYQKSLVIGSKESNIYLFRKP